MSNPCVIISWNGDGTMCKVMTDQGKTVSVAAEFLEKGDNNA